MLRCSLCTYFGEFLSRMGVIICQMLFLHLWRSSCDFYAFFCSCGVSCWFANIKPSLNHWTKSHLIKDEWSFLSLDKFSLLILCRTFLLLYSSEILAFNFFFGCVFGFGIRVMVVSWNEFGSNLFILSLIEYESI